MSENNQEDSQEQDKYKLAYTNAFKKEYKKYKNQPLKKEKVLAVLALLMKDGVEAIDPKMKPHPLIGNYQGCLECHIEPDLLLIWREYEEDNVIILERIGSHSELFGKNKK